MADPLPSTDNGSYGASFGSMASDAARATRAYADVTREKVAAETKTEGEMTRRGEEDRKRSLEAYSKEGVQPEEFKPWNAEAEHKKFETDPIQGVGSLGSTFAMIASAFTKAPMLSALEGMAGALNGIKEGNEASYKRNFDAYKENIQVAKAKHEIEHQAYTDALALGTHDLALSNAKLRAEASRFGDKQILALAENGMVKEIYDTIAARNRAVETSVDLADKTTIRGMQQRSLQTAYAQIDQQQGPPGPDGQPTQMPEAVKAAQKLRIFNTVMASGKMTAPQQTMMSGIIMENPTANIDQILQKAEEKHLLPRPIKPAEAAAQQGYEAELAEHKEAGDLTPETQNAIYKKWFPQGRAGAAAQSPERAEQGKKVAEAIVSGRQPPVTTGLYGLAPIVRADLEERNFDLAKAQLEWDSAKKQVQSLNGPQMVRFVGLAQSVDNTIDEAIALSREMDNSGIPKLNAAKLYEMRELEGNSKRGQLAAKYIATINTLKEEFANLANGGYAPTEPAWKLANQQINADYGVNQLDASLKEVQRLIRYRLQGIPNIGTLGPGAENRFLPKSTPPAVEGPSKEGPDKVIRYDANGERVKE